MGFLSAVHSVAARRAVGIVAAVDSSARRPSEACVAVDETSTVACQRGTTKGALCLREKHGALDSHIGARRRTGSCSL